MWQNYIIFLPRVTKISKSLIFFLRVFLLIPNNLDALIWFPLNESKVLFHLYKKSNLAVKREDLANILKVSDRSVDVIIKRLRQKINHIPNHRNLLLTSRGIGYKMEVDTLWIWKNYYLKHFLEGRLP